MSILAVVVLVSAADYPPVPDYYSGYVFVDGYPAEEGVSVIVEVTETGEVVSSTSVLSSNGYYELHIEFCRPALSVCTLENTTDGKATLNTPLTFKVGGVPCTSPSSGSVNTTVSGGGFSQEFILRLGEYSETKTEPTATTTSIATSTTLPSEVGDVSGVTLLLLAVMFLAIVLLAAVAVILYKKSRST